MQPLRIFPYTVGIMNLVPGVVLGALMAGGLASAGPLEAQAAPRKLIVESAALETGQPMPRDYTPDGRNISPPLS